VFLFSVYSSVFLLVFGLLSIGAALYYFLWFSRGCGRVRRSGGGSGWAPVPFVVYPPSCRSGWFHTTLNNTNGMTYFRSSTYQRDHCDTQTKEQTQTKQTPFNQNCKQHPSRSSNTINNQMMMKFRITIRNLPIRTNPTRIIPSHKPLRKQ